MTNRQTTGHLLAAFTIMIWGTTFVSTKVLLNDFTPIEILVFRFIMGFIALMIVFPHKMQVKERKHELYFIAAGITGVTLYYLLENIALTYTYASNVGVIGSLAPIFTAVVAFIFLREEALRINFFFGFIVALVGIYFISFNGIAKFELNPLGDVLAILATLVWAFYSVITRKISKFGYHTIQMTRRIFFYGIIFMLPTVFFMDFRLGLERFTDPINLFNIIFLGLGASALCFVTWNFAVKVLGPIKTSIYIYLSPVITVVASMIILHEKLTLLAAIGMFLTLLGLFISDGRVLLLSRRLKAKKGKQFIS